LCITNSQQARRERDKELHDRKVEAYTNSLRSLLKVAHRRSSFDAHADTAPSEELLAKSIDEIVEAEYWMTMLTTACGSKYREKIKNLANDLFAEVDGVTGNSGRRRLAVDKKRPDSSPLETVYEAYGDIAWAARDDIGFTE
jgi:hypothetical protein